MKRVVDYVPEKVDPAYEIVSADTELVLREKARPDTRLRAPLIEGQLHLVPDRSSIHRRLLAMFG